MSHPPIVSHEDWLAARMELLVREKAHTRQGDAVHAQLRRLPMVKIAREYVFTGPDGTRSLLDLFAGQRQLIVYHFMFDPSWEAGCPSCTGFVDAIGDLRMLEERNTTFVLISRAPLEKLEAYRALHGWRWPWVSSYGSDFNHDFHVTLDAAKAPAEYNYRDIAAPEPFELPGLSVFFRVEDEVFHDVLDLRARGRKADRRVQSPGCHALRPAGGMGRLAVRLAAAAHVRVAATQPAAHVQ